MAEENQAVKDHDILDDVKKVEREIKVRTLAKVMEQIKDKAHEVLELKEEINALLEAAGVETDDIKRIIDFVNSLDSVQLSEADKREIRKDAKDDVRDDRKQVQQKIVNGTATMSYPMSAVYTTTTGATGTSSITTNATNANYVSMGSGSSKLDVKLK